MIVEINDEVLEQVVLQSLLESYDITYENLRSTIEEDELIAVHSFDYDEEIFRLVEDLNAYELVIKDFGGVVKHTAKDLLKDNNEMLYDVSNEVFTLKKDNEHWKAKALTLQDELDEMRRKMFSILGR